MIDFSALEAATKKWEIATGEVNAAILPIITQICSSKDLELLKELKNKIPPDFPGIGIQFAELLLQIMVAELLLQDESTNTYIS